MPLLRQPLLALCLVPLGLAMLVPSLFGLVERDWHSMRSFLYGAIFTLFAAAVLALALSSGRKGNEPRAELRDLVVCWFLVPLFAAIPVWLRTPLIGAGGAWFEMLSAFTTTGGTIYAEPGRIAPAIHLWRGIMGWLGGLLTLSAAFAILAPRGLGGFEVIRGGALRETLGTRRVEAGLLPEGPLAPFDARLARVLRTVVPVYAILTAILAFLLSATGEPGLEAAVHAMSVVSTSGISPRPEGFGPGSSFAAEAIAALFLVLAATRLTYRPSRRFEAAPAWHREPELRLMALLVGAVSLTLFVRHWLAAITVAEGGAVGEALRAAWGTLFTTLSFLTTTGFTSSAWESARDWSGLGNPGLVLLGLCAIGGGAATTAGGIKLIRAHALLRHGYRELERLAMPRNALASGTRLRRISREGVFLAWAFVMLYITAIFALMMALTLAGLGFEEALVASVAAISNTGPALGAVLPDGPSLTLLDGPVRVILAIAMVIGRIETLAIISLFAPESWPRLGKGSKIEEKETAVLRSGGGRRRGELPTMASKT